MTGPSSVPISSGGPMAKERAALHKPLEELVVHGVQGDDAGGRGEALAPSTENGPDNDRDRHVEIGVGVDDDGVRAAQLGDHPTEVLPTARGASSQLCDSEAVVPGPGEDHHVDTGMARQMSADLIAETGHERHDAIGNPDFTKCPHENSGDRRRLLGWLQYHRVARNQSRCHHVARDHEGKARRRDHCCHTAALAGQPVRLSRWRRHLATLRQPKALAPVALEGVDRFSHVRVHVGPALARFDDFQGRDTPASPRNQSAARNSTAARTSVPAPFQASKAELAAATARSPSRGPQHGETATIVAGSAGSTERIVLSVRSSERPAKPGTSPPSDARTVSRADLITPGASGANHLTSGSPGYGRESGSLVASLATTAGRRTLAGTLSRSATGSNTRDARSLCSAKRNRTKLSFDVFSSRRRTR